MVETGRSAGTIGEHIEPTKVKWIAINFTWTILLSNLLSGLVERSIANHLSINPDILFGNYASLLWTLLFTSVVIFIVDCVVLSAVNTTKLDSQIQSLKSGIIQAVDTKIVEQAFIALHGRAPERPSLFRAFLRLWEGIENAPAGVEPALSFFLQESIAPQIKGIWEEEVPTAVEPSRQVDMSSALFRAHHGEKVIFLDLFYSVWSAEFRHLISAIKNDKSNDHIQFFLVDPSELPREGRNASLLEEIKKREDYGFKVFLVSEAAFTRSELSFFSRRRFEIYGDAVIVIEALEVYSGANSVQVTLGSLAAKQVLLKLVNLGPPHSVPAT